MSLQTSYRFIAPFYDALLSRITAGIRRRSLMRLPQQGPLQVLVNGAGTGLDFPYLNAAHHYTALDITAGMIARSQKRTQNLQLQWVQGDSMALPFANQSFDIVVLHLIVAVVPSPEHCLAEAARVLKPGGQILVFDKFLRPGERAWLRRSLSFVTAQIATRLNVVFEDVLVTVPSLKLISDEPALVGGWFRLIELRKNNE
jgi:phosphatidylethanolamine/phosphatidyl-N-methylethanolamine N-methyltransferase